jgi:hypothetical protein
MSQGPVTVQVDQATLDFFTQVAAGITAIKASGGSITADVTAVLATLPALIADVAALPAEVSGDKVLLVKSANLGAYAVLAALGVS